MIKSFETFEFLCDEIKRDKIDKYPSSGRYPVRLILLNDFTKLFQLTEYLVGQNVEKFDIDSLLEYEDQWVTSDGILNKLKSLEADTLFVPFSEVLRFSTNNRFTTILTSALEIENQHDSYDRRIYIPLVGLKERVEKDFLQYYHRRDIWAPAWYLDSPLKEKTLIYQVGFQLNKPHLSADIKNTRDWLNLWKKWPCSKVISISKNMDYLYKTFLPDTIFVLEIISNPKEYLQKISGISIASEYLEAEQIYWEKLLQGISDEESGRQYSNFSSYVHSKLNIKNLKGMPEIELLRLWFQKNDFERWLLKSWIMSFRKVEQTYFHRLISSASTYSDQEIILNIWFEIFELDTVSKENSEERKSYLKLIHEEMQLPYHHIEDKIKYKLRELTKNSEEILKYYICGISFEERKYIVEKILNLEQGTRDKLQNNIKSVYPELYYYLYWYDVEFDNDNFQDWIAEYFKEYNWSKLLNCQTDRLKEIINQKNADEDSFYNWYYGVNTPDELEEEAFVVWIDGLGGEWYSLLDYLIRTCKDRYIEKQFLRKVNLPTITESNRLDCSLYIRDLDSFNHEKTYKHPDDLIFQIDILKRIVKDILLKGHQKIIIASDHGFTVLAQKQFGNYKKFEFSDSNHEGRCMWTEKDYQNDSDYIVHTGDEGKKALVALRHSSLHNTPPREVHGGATPEEVLVPFIVISKISADILYKAKVINKEISVKNPTLKIEIQPDPPDSPYLEIASKTIKFIKEGWVWHLTLEGFKPGTYPISIKILNQKIRSKIAITGGVMEKELF